MPISGLKVLITGSTDGIGRATAKLLAELGAEVILHGRSEESAREVAREIELVTGTLPRYFLADFCALASVVDFAHTIRASYPSIDVLVNNAGAGAGVKGDPREVTEAGHEKRFAVNYLAPVLLTELWLRIAERAPRVIVNVASAGQEPLDFKDLMMTKSYEGLPAYRRSKLALVMWTFDLAQRQPDIAVNALHPGSLLDTKIVRETFGEPWGKAEDGARAIRVLIERSLEDQVTGEYFDVERAARANPQAYNERARATLERATEELLAPFFS